MTLLKARVTLTHGTPWRILCNHMEGMPCTNSVAGGVMAFAGASEGGKDRKILDDDERPPGVFQTGFPSSLVRRTGILERSAPAP